MKSAYRLILLLLVGIGLLLVAEGCSTNTAVPTAVHVTAYHGYGYGPGWGTSWHTVHPGPGVDRPVMGPPSTVDLPPVPWTSDD